MHLLFLAIMVMFLFVSANGINTPKLGLVVKMRDLECRPNINFLYNTSCYLKAMRGSGGRVYIESHLKHPIKSANAHAETYRWYNGYKPYIGKHTFDMCRIFTNKASLKDRVFAKLLAAHSNINHTCPFEGALFMNGVEPDLSAIPSFLEKGRYRFILNFTIPDLKALLFSGSFSADIL